MSSKLRTLGALILVLMLAFGFSGAQAAPAKWEAWGPHVDEIIMPIIRDKEARRIAFERGESVLLPGLTSPDDIDKVKAFPNADLTQALGYHMFYLSFNMRTSPLDSQVLRQAIAHVIDRDAIIRTLFRGYMLPMTSFVPQASQFYKADVPTYAYSVAKAKDLLDKAGYKLDSTGKNRIDPKTGKPLREMKILTPTYDAAPTSAELGKMISEAAQAIGLPIKPEPMDFNVMLDKIDGRDYDMYMLAWSLTRIPTFLYDFFHSSQDVEAGNNTPGIRMPELDAALEELFYAPDLKAAKSGSDKAQMILAREMPYVPLYSRPYIDAWRKDIVTGYVPMLGYGAAEYQNQWTTLNIRRVKGAGGTIRWVLPEEPGNMSPVTGNSAYAWEVLGRTMDNLITVNPDTMEDMPWLAKKWDVGTWEPKKGEKGTVVTWYLEKGVKWADGVPFTAEDVKFTIDYLKDNKAPRYLSQTQDIVKAEVVDKYTVKVYFANVSYWHLYNADLAFLPKHIWQGKDPKTFEPWKVTHPTVKGLTCQIGTGPFLLKDYKAGEYVRLVKNPNYWRQNPPKK